MTRTDRQGADARCRSRNHRRGNMEQTDGAQRAGGAGGGERGTKALRCTLGALRAAVAPSRPPACGAGRARLCVWPRGGAAEAVTDAGARRVCAVTELCPWPLGTAAAEEASRPHLLTPDAGERGHCPRVGWGPVWKPLWACAGRRARLPHADRAVGAPRRAPPGTAPSRPHPRPAWRSRWRGAGTGTQTRLSFSSPPTAGLHAHGAGRGRRRGRRNSCLSSRRTCTRWAAAPLPTGCRGTRTRSAGWPSARPPPRYGPPGRRPPRFSPPRLCPSERVQCFVRRHARGGAFRTHARSGAGRSAVPWTPVRVEGGRQDTRAGAGRGGERGRRRELPDGRDDAENGTEAADRPSGCRGRAGEAGALTRESGGKAAIRGVDVGALARTGLGRCLPCAASSGKCRARIGLVLPVTTGPLGDRARL